VRRCRQRKREQEEGLRRQIADLETENAKMKERIAQGSETQLQQTTNELKRITDHLQSLLNSAPFAADDDRLPRLLALFFERRRTHSTNMEVAVSLMQARVARRVHPVPAMKLYLWHGTCPDSYFERTDGMFAAIQHAMGGLQPAQKQQLLARRAHISALRAQVMELGRRVKDLASLANRDVELNLLEFASGVLDPRQLARLVVWLRDHQQPRAPASSASMMLPPPLPPPPPRVVRASPAELARERIILLTNGLWDAPKEKVYEIATSFTG
jgi:hypothetical protein